MINAWATLAFDLPPVIGLAQFSTWQPQYRRSRLLRHSTSTTGAESIPHDKLFALDLPNGTLSLLFQRAWTGGRCCMTTVRQPLQSAPTPLRRIHHVPGVQDIVLLVQKLAFGSVVDVGTTDPVAGGNRVMLSRNGRFVVSQPTSQMRAGLQATFGTGPRMRNTRCPAR